MKQALRVAVLLAAFSLVPFLLGATIWDFLQTPPGTPGTATTFTVTSYASIGTTACGLAPIDQPAAVQVWGATVWFVVNAPASAAATYTATPLSTDFVAASGDLILLRRPSLARFIASPTVSTGTLHVQCFE